MGKKSKAVIRELLLPRMALFFQNLRDYIFKFTYYLSVKRYVVQRGMFILLPIVILIGDYISFPSLFENRVLNTHVSITNILNHHVTSFGTIKGHDIRIAIDRIGNENYLSYVKGDSNALVISLYVYEKSEGAVIGALGQAVLSKLMKVSPDDGRRFRDLIDQFKGLSPGSILELDLHVPQEQYDRFPIKHLFVLLIEYGDVRMNEGVFSQGISNVLNKAVEKNVSSLIIPCLAACRA